ncbi:MAG: sialate O-acetylesterase [Phycisphaeraceae bacterium]
MFKTIGRMIVVLMMVAGGHDRLLRAEVRLPGVIGSNMVLQRDGAAPIWGWADPGESVAATVGEVKLPVVQAGADGKWLVKIPPQKSGGPITITVQGTNTLTLTNVLFGDVWVCSGQSNMEMALFKSSNGQEDAAAADFPNIRLFKVAHKVAPEPQDDCEGRWVECSPQTVRMFSAVGYYFGRDLHQSLNVPVGLVHSAFGGTPAGAWMPRSVLQANPDFASILKRADEFPQRYAEQVKLYEVALSKWEKDSADAKTQGQPEPRKPRPPVAQEKSPVQPGVLYNGMIHPLIPLGIKGVVWYQGENNAAQAYQYRSLLPALIQSWRQDWGQGDFAFGIVQLPNYMARAEQPGNAIWAELREAQAMTARQVPNCGLAVTIDLGEEKDIHPRNKHDVGRRLSLWALAQVYGQDLVASGPVYEGMKPERGAIRITFAHAHDGLMAKDGEKLTGFAIAGEDRKFVWADARIEGSSVIVSSAQVPNPAAVRYAWANNPQCNLYNKAGLPAAPFRTDDWPGISDKDK